MPAAATLIKTSLSSIIGFGASPIYSTEGSPYLSNKIAFINVDCL